MHEPSSETCRPTAARRGASSGALLGLLALAGVLVGWWIWSSQGAADGASEGTTVTIPPAQPSSDAQLKADPAPEIEPAKKVGIVEPVWPRVGNGGKGMLPLPDGTYVPALNGVRNPAVIPWTSDRPYSPIVGRKWEHWKDQGMVELYIHADGSRTTTLIQDVLREGRISREPVTIVQHPLPEGTPAPEILGEPDLETPEAGKKSGAGKSAGSAGK